MIHTTKSNVSLFSSPRASIIPLFLLILSTSARLTSASESNTRSTCLRCSHQQVTSPGGYNAKTKSYLDSLAQSSTACATLANYNHTAASVACPLQEKGVCEFHLVMLELEKGNETYGVQTVERGCITRYTDQKECFHTGLSQRGDYGEWTQHNRDTLEAQGYRIKNLTSERCYCNATADCNSKAVLLPDPNSGMAVMGSGVLAAGMIAGLLFFRITE